MPVRIRQGKATTVKASPIGISPAKTVANRRVVQTATGRVIMVQQQEAAVGLTCGGKAHTEDQ